MASAWGTRFGENRTMDPYSPVNRSRNGYAERKERIEMKKSYEEFQKEESRLRPPGIDYAHIEGLRVEARQKLDEIRPLSVGQASRISGVSPADIAVLLIWLEQNKPSKE